MTGNPRLAEGLAEYLSAVRGTPGGPLETARLLADRNAHRIAYPMPMGMTVANSFVVRAGDEVPVRIYRPAGEGVLPAIVYFHGGGFTTGSIETYQPLAMALAEATSAVVISVQYTRLPEATPRAIVEQCYDALAWTARMARALAIDPERIAVAGDSAGAFLAVQVAILARDRGGPKLVCQLLAYGVFDVDEDRAAYAAVRDPVLTLPLIRAVIAAYRSADVRDPAPFEVPLRSDLGSLPPAILLEAEYDAMVDEGREFVERLRAAGVHAKFRVAPNMCHGFLRAVRFSAPARAEMRWLGDAFRTLTLSRNQTVALKTEDPAFQAGRELRRQMFGDASIERLDNADDFNEPLENYVTSAVFGETWTRPGLTLRERCLITVAISAALNRQIPLKRMVKCAITNGATKEDIRETLLQTTMYIGVAGGVESWALAAEALKEIDAY